jgi:predicted nucleic acid-binding protein
VAAKRLILDGGALAALGAGDPRACHWAYVATLRGILLGIPAPVLAETLDGGAGDAAIGAAIPSHDAVLPTTREIAEEAGALRARSKRDDATVDALVIATALQHPGSLVLTTDPKELRLLAALRPEAAIAIAGIEGGRKKQRR